LYGTVVLCTEIVTGKEAKMSIRSRGRVVGSLFLLAFAAYLSGSALVGSGSGTPEVLPAVLDNQIQIAAGALLMLLNSVVVAGIGVTVLPILRQYDEIAAYAYLVSRTVEAVLLAVGVVFVLLLLPLATEYATSANPDLPALARVALAGNQDAYQVAMIAVGVGGVVLCRVLFRAVLVPRLLAAWGMAGYAIFAVGAILEILGYGVGLALSVPGGLFELVLGVLLIARGFPVTRRPDREAVDEDPAVASRAGR
jgi:hypothetical protein